jgi:hypothetical protein
MKKMHLLLFALGLGFLVFLIWRTGIHNLWQQLTLLGWRLIPIVLAEGIAELFHAISWRYCFSGPLRRISLLRLCRIHFAGYALNFLTPTASLAGEVTKAGLLATDHQGPESVSAVVIGKLSFGLSHLLFVAVGALVLLPVVQLSPALRIALLLSGLALATGMVIFLLLQKHGKLGAFLRWLVARNIFARVLQRFVAPMERVDEILKTFYRERPWDLVRSVLWHLLGYLVGVFATWYFLLLLGNRSPLITAAQIWFLVLWFDLVTFAVPLNLGVLEGGRLVAFQAFGFGALPGMTFGAVTRIAQLFWAGFGLITYASLIRPAPSTVPQTVLSPEEAFNPADPSALQRPQTKLHRTPTAKTLCSRLVSCLSLPKSREASLRQNMKAAER